MLATVPVIAQRYRPFARIGRGGMAEVFLASTRAPGVSEVTKLVVLKRIWDELAADPDFLEMFLDEARLSARMSHPNVVQTYEVTDERGRLTMAMEYLHGQPLTKVLNRLGRSGDLTLALRLRIVIDILAGLDHAHELSDYDGTPLGVVHRDVSPQNVFITYDGHVKLVDFGVAKTLAGMHQTRPGAIKGKLAYMAPEQLCGPAVDRRADIFSVGVILWEMLAGRRLFQGMTEVTIVHHLSFGLPVPEFKAELNLPDGLEQICLRALAPNPDDRFATAAQMEDELRRVLPAVTDSHARHLGKIVSLAFASERAERQQLIDRHLSGTDSVVFDENDGDAADENRTVDTRPSTGKSLVRMLPTPGESDPTPSNRGRTGGLGFAALLVATSFLMVVMALLLNHRSPVSPARSVTAAAPGGVALASGATRTAAPQTWTSGPITVPMPVAVPPSAAAAPPVPSVASTPDSDLAAEAATPHWLGGPLELGDDLHRAHSRRERRWVDRWAIRSRHRPKGERWSDSREDSAPRRLADAFSVEVGGAPAAVRRRDIDRASPFTP